MTRRADFLNAAKGKRVHGAAFVLQSGRRAPESADHDGPRIGLTVTKKVGNAPERNRIRRRLRAAIRLSETLSTEPETDYVVVARRDALGLPFGRLIAEFQSALRRSAQRTGPRKPVPRPAPDTEPS